MPAFWWSIALWMVLCLPALLPAAEKTPRPQYQHGAITIPAASAQEPKRESLSLPAAIDYLEKGNRAWTGSRRCIACHTNGSYAFFRPELSRYLGPPPEEARRFLVEQLQKLQKTEREKLRRGIRPTQIAYLAAGLAQWDRHIGGSLSPETDAALRLMFSVQSEDGSQGNATCWPPHESSSYHGATVAAQATCAAPGWLQSLDKNRAEDRDVLARVERLRRYLQTTPPPHDYAAVLLLWSACDWPELLPPQRKRELIQLLWKHQRPDGGWSIRTFARPEQWGRGNRAARLRAEPDASDPPSDGHMTGLAVLVLRQAGVPAQDARIQKALRWLERNQRRSGRWWTRSLNTDRYHFITYTGTLYPVVALARCGRVPPERK